jgi:hypothetical protein
VVPAIFQFTNNPNYKYNSEYYTVQKNGYVIFDFIDKRAAVRGGSKGEQH